MEKGAAPTSKHPDQIFKCVFKGVASVQVSKLLGELLPIPGLRLGVQPAADSPDGSELVSAGLPHCLLHVSHHGNASFYPVSLTTEQQPGTDSEL